MPTPFERNSESPNYRQESPREGDVRGEESGLAEPKPDEPEGNEPDDLDFNELDPAKKDRTWGA